MTNLRYGKRYGVGTVEHPSRSNYNVFNAVAENIGRQRAMWNNLSPEGKETFRRRAMINTSVHSRKHVKISMPKLTFMGDTDEDT